MKKTQFLILVGLLAVHNAGAEGFTLSSPQIKGKGRVAAEQVFNYAPVACGSGVVVTRGREFPNSKRAGRNASEPTRSLVNEVEKPTLCSEGEGRWIGAETTEMAHIISRGGRGGMFSQIYCPVLEPRYGGGETID